MTDAEIVIDVNAVPWKELSPILVILFRLIDRILRAKYRAPFPILVTAAGMVYVVAVLPVGYKTNLVWSLLNTKLLIFSEYNKTFELIDEVLSQFPMIYTKYISDAKLLERYKKRNINILLLNALSHSAGLNLENTTDIIIYHEMTSDMETQIIGRANRLGRTIGPLNVWKFV